MNGAIGATAHFGGFRVCMLTPPGVARGVFRRMHETVVANAKASPNVCGVRLYVEESNERCTSSVP